MKKEEFYYDSRDGVSKIHAVRYLPEETSLVNGKPRGILQIVHGMAEYAERYEGFAQFLTERGFVAVGNDHLGHGESVAEGGTYGYFCSQDPATVVVRDVHRLKKMTQEEYPGIPYFIFGHSMGSFILRNYISRYGTGIQGAILAGTGAQPAPVLLFGRSLAAVQKFFCGEKHVSKLLAGIAFGTYNRRIPNPDTLCDWMSSDKEVMEKYMADPLCGFLFTVNGFQTLFELIARMQKKENLEKVPADLPVLFLSGAEDPVGNYGKGVRKAYQALKDAGVRDVRLKIYDDDRHELLNEVNRAEVMQEIYEWLCQNSKDDNGS